MTVEMGPWTNRFTSDIARLARKSNSQPLQWPLATIFNNWANRHGNNTKQEVRIIPQVDFM